MLMNMVGISSCIAGDQVSNVNSAKKVHLPFLFSVVHCNDMQCILSVAVVLRSDD